MCENEGLRGEKGDIEKGKEKHLLYSNRIFRCHAHFRADERAS